MRVGQWERWTNWPLTAAAVLFLVAYAVPIIWPQLPPSVLRACSLTSWATWVLFAIDLVTRLVLAPDRRRYLLRHWFDVLVVVLPLLRPLRLLRLVPLLRVLNRHATAGLRGRLGVYVAGGARCLRSAERSLSWTLNVPIRRPTSRALAMPFGGPPRQ